MTAKRLFRISIVVLAIAAIAPLTSGAAAQDSSPELQLESIDISAYPNVHAVVVGPRNLTTDAIRSGTFTVTEGGAKREATVEPLPTNDLAVVLVIDTSGSMKGDAILAARNAATSFVSSMPPDTRIAVVGFGTVATIRSPFTTDHGKTTAALSALQVRGQTALHDAVIVASKLFENEKLSPGTRRVMVLLSDGGDTASKSSLAGASQALRAADVALSAIALATRESDSAALQILTSSTGGATAQAADPTALKGVFDSVANSVLRQYRVAWTSTGHGDSEVRLELKSGDRTWQAVRAVSFPAPSPTAPPVSTLPSPAATTVTAPALPIPRVITADSGRKWLYGGLGAGFLSALLALGVVFWPRPPKRRLATELGTRPRNEVSGFSQGMISATRTYFQRHDRGRWLATLLERAGMTMDAPTAAVLTGAVSVCLMAFALLLAGAVLAFFAGVLGLMICLLLLKSRADRRSQRFQDQFEACLQIIINSLRSGYGVSQAISTVARESEAPASEEFRRIVAETTLGMDQIDALQACAKRMNCAELQWVSESMEVNRDVGGNLANVLTGVAETIRSRARLARQVNSISAEGRISAQILLVMPGVAFVIQAAFNRSSLALLFHGIGLVLLVAGIASMALGYLWTRRIVHIKY